MIASNTKDVFRHAIGKRVVGLYTKKWSEHAGEPVVLVLDDGTGVAFGANGSHWVETAEDVKHHAAVRHAQLRQLETELKDVMALEAVQND